MYYKNPIIILMILLGVVCNAYAANNFTTLLPRNISVQVQHPDTKDFSLAVTNSTDKEILFRNCNFDCDCLKIISYSKNNVKCGPLNINLAPNDILNIKFKLDSKFYSKPKVLPVYFYFNNLVPAVQIVKVKADIKSDIVPEPENMACIIPKGFKGKIGSFALKMKNKNIKIDSIKSNLDSINAKYNPENNAIDVFVDKPLTVNTDAWLNVSVSQIPPSKGGAEGRGMLSNCVQELLLHIREIKIIPDLYAVPNTIDFGVISKPGEIVGKEIVFKSRTDTPWKIIGSQIKGKNKNAVKRKILPQTNTSVNVLWAILDGKIQPGLIKTEIIINTDHPYSKHITIPVNGQVLALNKKSSVKSKKSTKVIK
ncbi:hypothetical protein KAH27_04925 [bacterium]|nr:hypothetical protein [bacterium]